MGNTSWGQTLCSWARNTALGTLFGPADLTGTLRLGGPNPCNSPSDGFKIFLGGEAGKSILSGN